VHSVFYQPDGPDAFVSTPSTIGPWSAQSQHGGPPSALAARLLEACEPDANQRLASVTVDILRPVPIARLTASTRVVRPGRRVTLLETTLTADDQEVLHARGWRIARSASPPSPGADPGDEDAAGAPPDPRPPAIPPAAPPDQPQPTAVGVITDGYMSAMEWRYITGGGLDTPGPAAAWVRPTIPLLPGEDMSPMSRALLVADSGNGVSALLDPARFLFLNVDLTVTLHRDPAGEWLLLDAATTIGPAGTGVAVSTLSDTTGPCGRGMQTLLVAPRA
jgi:Thioesterase-like superfamily